MFMHSWLERKLQRYSSFRGFGSRDNRPIKHVAPIALKPGVIDWEWLRRLRKCAVERWFGYFMEQRHGRLQGGGGLPFVMDG